MKFKGWDFKTAAREVEEVLRNGTSKPNGKARQKESTKDPRIALRKVFNGAKRIREGGEVDKYLRGRGLSTPLDDMNSIMEHPCLQDYESRKSFPAMLALVKSADGRDVTIHRTYLRNGKKAPIESPRKVMTPVGTINGSAVRLFPIVEHIGIGEGIETSIAAFELFNLPVWAVLNANGIRSFMPVRGIKEIKVFADNDENYTGQAAAYHAANRLTLEGYKVNVTVPKEVGTDWLDVLNTRRAEQSEIEVLI